MVPGKNSLLPPLTRCARTTKASGVNPRSDDQSDVWLELAELFFLDTEHDDAWYQAVAKKLSERGLSKGKVERILIDEVAPIAGANCGYLIWPVIGEWAGFDREQLCSDIETYLDRRARRPRWFYLGQHWWMRRMVAMLAPERLLGRL
jgi:hypothetical protein